jgi:hypothetical protein
MAGNAGPSLEYTRFKRGLAGWAAASLLGHLARSHSLHDRILKSGAVAHLEVRSCRRFLARYF